MFHNSDKRKCEGDQQLTASQKHGIITQQEYMERENSKIVFANQGLENWKHVEPYDFVISLRSFQGGLEMSETIPDEQTREWICFLRTCRNKLAHHVPCPQAEMSQLLSGLAAQEEPCTGVPQILQH